jgi:hypothetical protein
MAKKRISRIQRKTTNNGRFVSFTVHLILLLLAFLPFLSFHAPEPPTKEALVLQFDYPFNQYIAPEKFVEEQPKPEEIPPVEGDFSEASKMSGSEAGGNEIKSPEPAQSRPKEAAPAALKTQSAPTTLKSTTPSTPITSPTSDISMPLPKIYNKTPSKSNEWASIDDVSEGSSDNVQEMRIIDSGTSFGSADVTSGGNGDDDSSITSEGFGTKPGGSGGTGNGTGNTTGNGSGPGGGTGTGNAGSKTGVGNNGTGMDFGVGLNGLLNRKIIKQGAIGKLAEKPGKIAIYVCVDQSGKVVGTSFDKVASTINDPAIIAKAEAVARSYLWAEDKNAPPKQCGKLTITFTLPK